MIKNNNHDTYVKSVPDIIRDVIMQGAHTLTSNESRHFNADEFFGEYETLMEQMNFPPVPLIVDRSHPHYKTVTIHPRFLQKLDEIYGHSEFDAYCYLFEKRFNELEHEKRSTEENQLGEFQEKNETPDEPKYRIPPSQKMEIEGAGELNIARQKNANYASASALLLFGDETNDYPDDYGWVENRTTLFCETMDNVCDYYALPRLPIAFDKDDVPFFDASYKKVDAVKQMYHDRKMATNHVILSLKDMQGSKKEYDEALGSRLARLRYEWCEVDNVNQGFDSQVLPYSDSFSRNGRDMIASHGGHIMTEAEIKSATPAKKFNFPELNFN